MSVISEFINLLSAALVIVSAYFANKGNTFWALFFIGVLVFGWLLSFVILFMLKASLSIMLKDLSKLMKGIEKVKKQKKELGSDDKPEEYY
jgi:ABC-type polysaccharide/polyol phosphate export permease